MYNWNYFENISEVHPIADANNLYDAFYKARKGSQWKGQVQRFRWNLLSEIRKLQKELNNFKENKEGAYQLSPYSEFLVNERGKVRGITALGIRDRVVKHVLNDIFLLPHIRSHLIYDNGASLEGKGVSFTRNRLLAHLESFYRETGSNDGYILTMDFSGYYDNIDHEKAMEMIYKYEPDEAAQRLVKQAYDSYAVDVSYMDDAEFEKAKHERFSTVEYRDGNHEKRGEKFLHKSLSVGDQTSQITAVAFATPIDTLIKTVNGVKYYARYMDDIYVIARTKEELIDLKDQICEKAKELKLFINPKKTKISKIDRPFTFLQFKYHLESNGHVVIRINPKTVTRMRRKLKKLYHLGTRQEKVESLFQSWIGNFHIYMSNKQIINMMTLYKDLFGGGLDQWMKTKHIV